jgi:hypothetical protein
MIGTNGQILVSVLRAMELLRGATDVDLPLEAIPSDGESEAMLRGITRLPRKGETWRQSRFKLLSALGYRKDSEEGRALALALRWHVGSGSLWSQHPWKASQHGTLESKADTMAVVVLQLSGNRSTAVTGWKRAIWTSEEA